MPRSSGGDKVHQHCAGNVEELNLYKTKMNEYTTSHLGSFSYGRSEKLSTELLVSYNDKLSCQVYFLTVYFSYNKRQLSRIYPKGTRVGSENYMPQVRIINNYSPKAR